MQTLDTAAWEYAPLIGNKQLELSQTEIRCAFKAGAEWQKEQYKQLFKLIAETCYPASQLLKELERLQD